jgi:hypothetical protein
MKLTMNPQSARTLPPMAQGGIVQVSYVNGAPVGMSNIKIRWRVSFLVRGEYVEESGESDSVYVG